MPYDLSLVGQPSAAADYEYHWKDVVLYALGIGARREELGYLYEKHGPLVYPSFAVIAPFAPVFEVVGRAGGELASVVHHAQKVRLHRVLAPAGTIRTVATIRGMWDLKRFVSVIVDAHSTDAKTGEPLFDTSWSLIFRGGGGFGGPPPPREEAVLPPQGKEPDFVVTESTSPEQALLYRLSGDDNPLHADPEVATKAGFAAGPILHGLCTFGFMVRHVIKAACGGDARRLRAFEAQFRKPVWPGDVLTTRGYHVDGNRVALQVSAEGRSEPVVTHAAAWLVD